MEARQAATQLTGSKAECSCENEAITADIEALQMELQMSTERHMEGQDAQMAYMSAFVGASQLRDQKLKFDRD